MMSDTKKRVNKETSSNKENYTTEEKKIVMDSLDEERRIHDKAVKGLDGKDSKFDQSEKNQILNQLNEQRLSKQKRAEIAKKRIDNKEVYKFGSKTFYKFLQMEREYYIQIEECSRLSSRPSNISLYYRTFDELKTKDVLIKTEVYSDKFFISYDPIRVYFKAYVLEDARKK